ncbi:MULTISPECIES: hypothetical protein [unclassified Clostridioides]|uniref:hypothetical protein n=1 Tax=unclassified Clostridioides TaxID=2635829 RepID=UPI001D106204|nr:hypothetical protein [Clostridioides sp. ZZV14-6154]MCC0717039.1 hypothetical protein [Clostridioides sp. ZZV14-6105]WLD28716.1 hypothetical protein CDIFMA2_26000 [Clostridioides difficile]
MTCGVRFCGGCNPRYGRGKALAIIKEHFNGRVDFSVAEEDVEYDLLLIIGGCTTLCASYQQYKVKKSYIKIWDFSHIERAINIIESAICEA